MKLNGAQIVLKMLEVNGVSVMFGYPGAATAPLYNKMPEFDIKHILVRNEQGAAHMANGYARVANKAGVCTATSGPGATNLVTGIATAYMDSIPLVAITGQVDTCLIGKDAFQEVDFTGTTIPFCKHNYLVKDVNALAQIINDAFYIATTGRPGPVVIDIPINIFKEVTDFVMPQKEVNIRGYKPAGKGHELQIKRALALLSSAEKPLILAGGGIISSGAGELFGEFVETMNIPVISTLMGIGAISSKNPLYFGMLGSHGRICANHAINNADLVMIMGSRIADRTVAVPKALSSKTKLIHIDIDPAEIGKNSNASIPIVGNVKTILAQFLDMMESSAFNCGDNSEWITQLQQRRDGEKPVAERPDFVNPIYVLNELSKRVSDNDILTTEVGQNQIWAANHFKVVKPGHFISSGGFGTMGYGLPAAIGAKIASPTSTVFCVSGDGSFQMSMPELGTMLQWGIDVKMILFNNNRLGMVRELQKKQFSSNYVSVFLDVSPDFCQLVGAYGIKSNRICKNDDVCSALDEMINAGGSYLLEFKVDPEQDCV